MDQPQLPAELFNITPMGENQELYSRIFSIDQIAVLNNDRVKIAQEIINLTYQPSKDEAYALQLAELQGQLGMLSYLIDASISANNILNNPNTQSTEE